MAKGSGCSLRMTDGSGVGYPGLSVFHAETCAVRQRHLASGPSLTDTVRGTGKSNTMRLALAG